VPPIRPGQVPRRRPNAEQEQQRSEPDIAGSLNGAPVVTPQNAHQLQQQIGNRAVGELASIGGGAEPESAESAEHTEPEEERSGYTESEIDVMLGRTEAFGPKVPTFEVISATTSAQLSRGELEREVGRLWTREQIGFTEAARQAAETDSATRQGSAVPTQSANFEPDQSYSRRWMLGFYAYDYEKGGSDLPYLKKLLRRGSGFQRSVQSDFDQVFPFENPSGAQISSEINEKSRHLRRGLERQESGELVVFFTGHGSGRSIMGADGKSVAWSELSSLASLAQDLGIHTVYVLDTCRAGSLASLAQLAAQDDIDEAVGDSGIADTAGITSRGEALRTLTTESLAAKEAALNLLDWHRFHRRAKRKRMAPDEIAEADEQRTLAAKQLSQHIANIYALLHRVEEETVPHRSELIRRSSALMLGSVWALDPRQIPGFLNDLAPFFDTMNDSINAQLIALRQTVEAARQTNSDG
jgi:hypothetical protein